MYSPFLGNLAILSMNCPETGRILGLWPFTGVIVAVLDSMFKSIHLSLASSPGSAPVSESLEEGSDSFAA